MRIHLAIDLGASGGRHFLGCRGHGCFNFQEIYRFENKTVEENGQLCWDAPALFSHIITGLQNCHELDMYPHTIGINTWGVDFALLDENDELLGNLVSYRDGRTKGLADQFDAKMPFEELYSRTGNAKQDLNTLYQLIAVFRDNPEYRERAKSMLFLPCYLSFLLTGQKMNEYTIASTSALLNARTRTWDEEVIKAAGLPRHIFDNPLLPPGSLVGNFLPELAEEIGFDAQVIFPPTHDTASAFLAVPAQDENAVYISSGTWSLLGIETDEPICTPESRIAGFNNEGCYGNKIRCIRNIMGLWLLQEIRREGGKKHSYAEMAEMAKNSNYPGYVNAADERFLAPASMIDAVRENLKDGGFPPPSSTEDILRAVTMGLAICYRDSIRQLEKLTGRRFTSINIVGGGSNNKVLNQWTADVTGLPVYAGPDEATALGNILSQMLFDGESCNIEGEYEIGKYSPQDGGNR